MTIVKLEKAQTERAASVLSYAFFNDPLMELLLPGTESRKKKLPKLMNMVVRYCRSLNMVEMTADKKAVACWLPPHQTDIKIGTKITAGAYRLPFLLGKPAYKRFLQTMKTTESLEQKYSPEPHWYLFMVGVDEGARGQGLGGKLIRSKISEAEAAGQSYPFYLETMNEDNVPLYEKLGFRVCEKVTVPFEGFQPLNIWSMKKD